MKNNKKNLNHEIIHIGVDARPLTSPLSGVSRVIFEILSNLPSKNKFQFYLFANKNCHNDFLPLLKQEHIQWVTGQGALAKKAGLYFNFSLPLLIRRRYKHLNIFWGSQQVIPPCLPKNLKVVLTYYDLVLYFFPKAMRPLARMQQYLVQKMSVNRADYILSISKQTMLDMNKKFNFPNTKSGVSLLGFNKKKWSKKNLLQLNQKTGLQLNNNYILAVSTIEPRKNYATLLNAWSDYQAGNKHALPLIIAGKKGWESDEFYNHLNELLVTNKNKLFVMQNLNDVQIATLYANCSFFCMTSLYEGFGLPLLEALSYNKTALVSDLPCFHEIAQDFAKYISAKDIKEWSKSIQELGSHFEKNKAGITKSYYKKYGLRDAKNFDANHWTWRKTAEKHSFTFTKK